MFPLSEIYKYTDQNYLSYVWKKTHFLINPQKPDQLQFLWEHIIKNFNLHSFLKKLEENEKKAFFDLLSNYGYVSPQSYSHPDLPFEVLEKKSMWIFKHPIEGIFIPLEIIKTLMKEKLLLKNNFLFSLLFRLKMKDQYDLAVLLENHYGIYQLLTRENNSLDMALVLYIWFLNIYQKSTIFKLQKKNKGGIIPFRFKLQDKKTKIPPILKEPKIIWDYMHQQYPDLHIPINKWYHIMKEGKKGFYYSLLLLTECKKDIWDIFVNGYLFPLSKKEKNLPDEIKVITPNEIYNLMKNKNIAIKKREIL